MVAWLVTPAAGLMGEAKAPNTWEAYRSGSFWNYIFSKWGDDIPKPAIE